MGSVSRTNWLTESLIGQVATQASSRADESRALGTNGNKGERVSFAAGFHREECSRERQRGSERARASNPNE